MKSIVITVVMFAIAVALIVGIIMPLSNHGREVGTSTETRLTGVDTQMGTLANPIR